MLNALKMPATRESCMIEIFLRLIGILLLVWFGYSMLFPLQETYPMEEAAEICHQAHQDDWQETAVLEFSDEWKTKSMATGVPGWHIIGDTIAVGEDGSTTHFDYDCIFKLRVLTSVAVFNLDPPENRN